MTRSSAEEVSAELLRSFVMSTCCPKLRLYKQTHATLSEAQSFFPYAASRIEHGKPKVITNKLWTCNSSRCLQPCSASRLSSSYPCLASSLILMTLYTSRIPVILFDWYMRGIDAPLRERSLYQTFPNLGSWLD